MAIKILGTRLLVKEIEEKEEEEKTASGLIIPKAGQAPRMFLKGEVISFGLDCQHVKVGDTVYFEANAAADIKLEGESYVVVDERSLFGVNSK